MRFQHIKEPEKLGSYSEEDVVFLLKDISNHINEQDNEQREKIIQNGGHYSEMLPIEYFPNEEYMDIFYKTLQDSKEKVARAVAQVGELIFKEKGEETVIVSLARAGTPIGILIKRYLKFKYKMNIPHYSISIIRGKGIDVNAVKYILNHHNEEGIQFVDGWTGKGAINGVLKEALDEFQKKYGIKISDKLAVLADPAYCVELYGTREDFLIPSACLNSTVSGLISRTVLRADLISDNDFHGAKFYREWLERDLSNLFIDAISKIFPSIHIEMSKLCTIDKNVYNQGIKEVKEIKDKYNIGDINLIKPGVGETTRVLLRRVPWKILINDVDNPNLKHILILAKDKQVPVEIYKNMTYSCCGLIKSKIRGNMD
ncbi:cysteine protease StiP precursor [Clostridium homopropionicum DSM 5847]|uniref:Cysteine protease StiP n=1 Tax=Clostridium homopropionicum DSM 5847 TaxID=1121318 RepID=A0A0L6Z7Z1_9CLOT|nr:cysteine protease StiP family protein [Clostridium homopropionicum]KOA18918.1 cysteine protease StiP precursor [Clostridium homopropionicum DSM 5847]SFG44562.1 PELOTA RNA binding domain-containing protein [Clostridium homopropionicum]